MNQRFGQRASPAPGSLPVPVSQGDHQKGKEMKVKELQALLEKLPEDFNVEVLLDNSPSPLMEFEDGDVLHVDGSQVRLGRDGAIWLRAVKD